MPLSTCGSARWQFVWNDFSKVGLLLGVPWTKHLGINVLCNALNAVEHTSLTTWRGDVADYGLVGSLRSCDALTLLTIVFIEGNDHLLGTCIGQFCPFSI